MSLKNRKQDHFGVIRIILVGVIGLLLLFGFLSIVSSSFAIKHQHGNSELKLSMAAQRMSENAADAEKDWEIYDAFIQAKVDSVSYLMDQKENGENDLKALANQWGLATVYLTDTDGNVIKAIGGSAKTLEEAGLERLIQYAKGEDKHAYKTVDGVCYYICLRDDGKYLVGGVESTQMIAQQDERFLPAYSLRDMKVGEHGFIMAFSKEDNTIAYCPNEDLIGKDISTVADPASFADGSSGWMTYNNAQWYYETADTEVDGSQYTLVAMASKADITESSNSVVWCVMGVCVLTVAFMITYAILHQTEEKKKETAGNRFFRVNKSWLFDLTKGRKMLTVLAIGLVVLLVGTAYMSAMAAIGRQMARLEDRLSSVEETLTRNDERTEEIAANYEDEYGRRAENIAWSLKYAPSLIDDNALETFCGVSQIMDIDVFNAEGKKDATSNVYKDFELSRNEEDQSYIFWNIIKGYEGLVIQEAQLNETTGSLTQYIGTARQDQKGMVQIAIEPSMLEGRLQGTKLSHILSNLAVENGGFLFSVDEETSEITSYPTASFIGKSFSDIGMNDRAVKDRYVGWQKLDGVSYFVMSQDHAENIVYAAVPSARIFADVIPVTLIAGGAGLIILVLMMLAVMLTPNGTVLKHEKHTPKDKEKRIFEMVEADGEVHRTQSAASRWNGSTVKFGELDASGKMQYLVKIVLGCAAILLLIAALTGLTAKSSLLTFILSCKWDQVFNLFSVSYVAYILVLIIAASAIVRLIIGKITKLGSSRMETVGRLLNSFIKYVAVIGAIFYGLQFFGVDSTTMLAGAGIFTLIIGLGAQSLVSDILAGLFIVFEGEFRVGDIVTIDGWRGTVEEIGIRTTKIQSPGQDIKIFRNSNISGVINQTRQFSFAAIDVGIEYGESLERVEAILKRELPHIKQHVPAIVDGPYYKGVSELGDSSVNIKIVAQCMEKDRIQVLRDLNREIKLVFDRNDIGIPFPQIVLNQAVTHEKANAAEKRAANEFVQEQKEITKNINTNDE